MARQVFPYKPTIPILDSYIWVTDIFQAKAAEQRIALRTVPARNLNLTFEVDAYTAAKMQDLMREQSGADGFYIPDWTQRDFLGTAVPDSLVALDDGIDQRYYGDKALVWESEDRYEVINMSEDSGGRILDQVLGTYERAWVMPLWEGDCPSGLSMSLRGRNRVSVSGEFALNAHEDLGASTYEQYRGHDVVPDCPVLAGGLDQSFEWPLSTMGSSLGNADYIRVRDLITYDFNLRWQKYNAADVRELLYWVSSRYGRQLGFWVSTTQKDLELAADISGTTLTAFRGVVTRTAPFDIEVMSSQGVSYKRQVTAATEGGIVNGRPTVELTLDSSLNLAIEDTRRVSFLIFARFDSDRAEFNHEPKVVTLAMPCLEIPVP